MLWRRCPGLMPRGLMDRQTLRDAVVRYNAKGLEGLHDRPKGYSPRRLTADEEAALAAVIIAGPEPERDGVCAWTRADLCRWLEERFAKTYHPSSMTRVLRRMGFSRQKARPSHPRRDAEAQDRASRHPEGDRRGASRQAPTAFQDEARVGNKGRVCHRWWRRGEVPPGRVKSATSGPTSSPPCARTPATTSPW